MQPLRIILVVLLLTAALPAVDAAEQLKATLLFQQKAQPMQVLLKGVTREAIQVQPIGGRGVISLRPADILQIRFDFPNEVRDGIKAANREDWRQVYQLLGPTAKQLVLYMGVEDNDGLPVVMLYATALRNLNQIPAAIAHFKTLRVVGTEQTSRLATAWIGYLLSRVRKFSEAESVLKAIGAVGRDDEVFTLVNLARTYIDLSKKEVGSALDHVAQVIAFGGLESGVYPEALFMSGKCYEGMAEAEHRAEEQKRSDKVKRAILAERVRIGREMQQAAIEKGERIPTEYEIVRNVDKASIEASVPPVPSVETSRYHVIAQDIYAFVIKTYPASPWAGRSKALLRNQPETAESDPS